MGREMREGRVGEGKYADAAIESIQTENCSPAFITAATSPHPLANKVRKHVWKLGDRPNNNLCDLKK